MNPAPAYVRSGERIVWFGRPTLRALASQAIGSLVMVLILGSILINQMDGAAALYGPAIGVLLLIVYATLMGFQALRLRRMEYVLTDQGVYTRSGLIGSAVAQTTFDKITDISVKQDVLGRALGYATLQLNTAGSNLAPVQMLGLRDAMETKRAIETARETSLGRERPASSAPAAVPKFVLAQDIVLVRCPKTRQRFKRPRADLGRKVLCPLCQGQHVVKED